MPRWTYWIDFYLYPLLTVLAFGTFNGWRWLLLFVFGMLLFSFAEYFVHSILLHHVFTALHKTHHDSPRTYVDIPWYTSFIITIPLMLFCPPAIDGGIFAAYSFYCFVHHFSHHPLLPHSRHNRLMFFLCRNHTQHHVKNNVNFGVTSPLFDFIFRTYSKPAGAL